MSFPPPPTAPVATETRPTLHLPPLSSSLTQAIKPLLRELAIRQSESLDIETRQEILLTLIARLRRLRCLHRLPARDARGPVA